MKVRIWPKTRASKRVSGYFKAPKPVNVGMKAAKPKKGNVIYNGATGAGKLGMSVGKNLYKIK